MQKQMEPLAEIQKQICEVYILKTKPGQFVCSGSFFNKEVRFHIEIC